jgi:hypothetical protein
LEGKARAGSRAADAQTFDKKGEHAVKKDYTHISVILDRTGSMESIRDDTIGGFNTFLKEQKAQPGAATLTLVQFDSQGTYFDKSVEGSAGAWGALSARTADYRARRKQKIGFEQKDRQHPGDPQKKKKEK